MSRKRAPRLVVALLAALVIIPSAASSEQVFQPPFDDGQERIWLNRLMLEKTGDNRDPNWDWTNNVTYTLESTAGTFTNVRLPYYANSGPAAALLNDSTGRDIEPDDGWELVLRDFGPGVVIPYYMLYNKYRGTLRVFYYSTLPQSFSSAVARLSYQNPQTNRSGAHFTFLDKDRYVNNYDPARSQVVVGAVAFHQWAFFDFDVSGYDPTIGSKADPTFIIEIAGVTQTDLTASGEVDLTTGPVSAAKSGSGFNVSGLISNVKKRHKDVKNFKEVTTDLAENAGSAWWAGPINAIKNLTEKSWFKALGPVAGILEFVIGGGSKKSTLPFPLSTKGTVTLNGTLTTQTPLYTLVMRVPGGSHADPANDAASNVLPLYDVPLGVLNVSSAPSFSATVTTDSIQVIPTGSWNISVNSSATTPLQIVYNQAVFQTANVTTTWAPFNFPATGYTSVASFNSGWNRSFSGGPAQGDLYVDLITGFYFSRFAIKAELTPIGAVVGLEPTTLYKVYSTYTNTSVVVDPPSGGGGGGGPGPGNPCIFCGGLMAEPDTAFRSLDGWVTELEKAQLERTHLSPQSLDEHIEDYALILAQLYDKRMDPVAKLEAARAAYRERLATIGGSKAWSELDFRMLEALALRRLASEIAEQP